MKKQFLAPIAIAFLLAPLGMNIANANPQIDNNGEVESQTIQIAQNYPDRGRKRKRGGGMTRILSQLDLTAEQSQQIRSIQEQFKADNESLREEIRAEHQEMRSLFSSDADPDDLKEQHDRIHDLRRELSERRFENMLEVRSILTPEQRSQMATIIEERGGRHSFREW